MEEVDTSEGSYNSENEDSEEDFNYDVELDFVSDAQLDPEIYKTESNGEINETLKKEIKFKIQDIHSWIYNNLDLGDNFTIFYVAHIYERAKQIEL